MRQRCDAGEGWLAGKANDVSGRWQGRGRCSGEPAVAACVSVLLLAGGGYYWWTGEVRNMPLAESGVIHHGSSKARLFLSTGTGGVGKAKRSRCGATGGCY